MPQTGSSSTGCQICRDIETVINEDRKMSCQISLSILNPEQEDCNCHSADCIEGKFLQAVEAQLDTLLALAENGMLIPDEILEVMGDIVAQDEENMKDLDEKGKVDLIMRRVIL